DSPASSRRSMIMPGSFARRASKVSASVTRPRKSRVVATQTPASGSQSAVTTIGRAISLAPLLGRRAYRIGRAASKLQRLPLVAVLDLLPLGQPLGRHRAVDLDQRDGVAALLFAAEMEGGDVDAGLRQQAGEAADEAGLVLVGHVQHRGAELRLHADALDVDDARPPVGVDRAGDVAGLARGGGGQAGPGGAGG